jgi:hypothetical protein
MELVSWLVNSCLFLFPCFLFLFLISFSLILNICLFLSLILILLLSLYFSFCADDGHISFSSSSYQNYVFYPTIINYSTHIFHAVWFNNGPFIRSYSLHKQLRVFDVLTSNISFIRAPKTEKCDVTASNGTLQSANSRRGHMT